MDKPARGRHHRLVVHVGRARASKAGLLFVATVALGVGGSLERPAHADPSEGQRARARTLVFEGRKLREEGKPRPALEKFRAAHAIMNVPTTGIELGLVMTDLKLLVEARDTMLEVSRMRVAEGEPLAFAQAREEARQYAADLDGRIPAAIVVVRSGPRDGVVVAIDGTTIDPSLLALPKKLNPGEHEAVARAPARADARVTFRLEERETRSIELDLSRPATTPAVVAETPASADASEGGIGPVAWVGFGVGAVGLAVGATAGILSLTKTSSVKDRCEGDRCPPDSADDLATARTTATVSNVAFGVAAVGIVVGIVALVVAPSRSSTSRKPVGGAAFRTPGPAISF